MFIIIRHQGNVNQNGITMPSYTCEKGYDQSHKWQLTLPRMWSKRNIPPLLGGVQTCWACLEIITAISQHTGNWSTSRPSQTTFGHIHKGPSILPQNTCLFVAALFITLRNRKILDVPQSKTSFKMWCIRTMHCVTQLLKKWHPEIF